MALRVISQPATEPVALTDAKNYLRVDYTDDDNLITALIVTARQYCEEFQNRAYITQTFRLTLDHFPHHRHLQQSMLDFPFYAEMYYPFRQWRHNHRHHEIRLPRPPIQSVLSVSYTDDTGTTTTMDPTTYIADAESEPGRIVPASQQDWPVVKLQPINGVQVEYTAGYGDAAVDVPATVRQAMMMIIDHWYMNREAAGIVTGETAFAVHSLLGIDRVVNT